MKNCATLAARGDKCASPGAGVLRKKLPQAKSAVANSTSHGTRRPKIDGGVARRMSAPRPPPTRLITNNLRIVSPARVPESARPVKPVTSWAGNRATVEGMLAARASMPVSLSDGRGMNEPPPASAFCTPAHIAAMKRTTRAIIATFVLVSGQALPRGRRDVLLAGRTIARRGSPKLRRARNRFDSSNKFVDGVGLFSQRAAAVGSGRIGGVAGHRREQIIIVPIAFALRRLFDFEQIEVRHH